MSWRIYVRSKAERQLRRLPRDYMARMEKVMDEIGADPFSGDVEKMEGEDNVWRRRIGAYRIKYEIYMKERIIRISEIERRASSTY